MLCFVDLIPKDFNKVVFPPNLTQTIENIVNEANNIGLYYPTIKIKPNEVTLKYDQDSRYVIFTITPDIVTYGFGILGGSPKTGDLRNLKVQLKQFSNFIYPEESREEIKSRI